MNNKSPWSWIPSLYFAEAVPYVAVMSVATLMYSRLGLSNTEVAWYTSWLYLPWVIKPFWSPIVEMFGTKRAWIVAMQILIGAGLAGVAFTIGAHWSIRMSLACFWLLAFSSATHDIAADGIYIDALTSHEQTLYVGIRSTFYRIATIVAQGGLIWVAGMLETFTHRIAYSWSITFYLLTALFIGLWMWHTYALPHPNKNVDHNTIRLGVDRFRVITPEAKTHTLPIIDGFMHIFFQFFTKPQALVAIVFMLLYRLPEALLVKICPLFLIGDNATGGMGLTTAEVGYVQGTLGVIGLTAGGIIGGILASRHGLKRWLWPMVLSITLPDLVYVLMSLYTDMHLILVAVCIFIEQFGYGFGFTAYMLYMLYYSKGKYSTSHYSFCTGFMALSMMLPGLIAGWLQETLGYTTFFVVVIACCSLTFIVTALLKIDPEFGKKK